MGNLHWPFFDLRVRTSRSSSAIPTTTFWPNWPMSHHVASTIPTECRLLNPGLERPKGN